LRRPGISSQIILVARPLEKRPRIGLATGSDMLVPGDIGQSITLLQPGGQSRQYGILHFGKRLKIGPFQLDPDRKVVTAFAPTKERNAGMPGAVIGRHELQQRTIALNHEMRRDPQRTQLVKIRMSVAIQRIAKQVRDKWLTKLPRRQPSPNFDTRAPEMAIDLLVIHNISLPPCLQTPAISSDLQRCRNAPDD